MHLDSGLCCCNCNRSCVNATSCRCETYSDTAVIRRGTMAMQGTGCKSSQEVLCSRNTERQQNPVEQLHSRSTPEHPVSTLYLLQCCNIKSTDTLKTRIKIGAHKSDNKPAAIRSRCNSARVAPTSFSVERSDRVC